MNSKKHRKYIETAKALPAYCIYPDDYHFSDAWADKLIAGWISLKRVQVESKWDNARFRDALIDLVIELSEGWEAEFLEAARQEGMTFDCVSYEVQEQMHQPTSRPTGSGPSISSQTACMANCAGCRDGTGSVSMN